MVLYVPAAAPPGAACSRYVEGGPTLSLRDPSGYRLSFVGMLELDPRYGELVRIDPNSEVSEEVLRRIPLGTPVAEGGIDESTLRDLLFRFPGALPVARIDASYAAPVPVCCELSTPAGYVDAVFVNSLGRLTLAEFKLWRNPQARREVIGQVLDYAKEFASWSYEDLQREVSRTLGRKGNVLYELVRSKSADLQEAEFVDNVSRHLARGEFLLLIVGDGIREGVENIVEFVQRYSGLHFTLALVEAALYRDSSDRIIVQPRCLARTEVVQRFVIEGGVAQPPPGDSDEPLSDNEEENLRFWTAVLRDYAFSDVTVEVPEVSKESAIYVKVRHSGFGGWGLSFVGYLYRNNRSMGCYMSCRKGIAQAERVFSEVKAGLDGLRGELGDDLQYWENNAGRPRIGFWRKTQLPFPPDGANEGANEAFEEAVAWMRVRLEGLVSALHPRLQKLLAGK